MKFTYMLHNTVTFKTQFTLKIGISSSRSLIYTIKTSRAKPEQSELEFSVIIQAAGKDHVTDSFTFSHCGSCIAVIDLPFLCKSLGKQGEGAQMTKGKLVIGGLPRQLKTNLKTSRKGPERMEVSLSASVIYIVHSKND